MSLRADLHERFFGAFGERATAAAPVGAAEVARLAAELGTELPGSYVHFLQTYGAVYCPSVLRLVMRFGLEHPDLRQFFSPEQALERSCAMWGKMLPADLYVFACDCMGNAFCFRKSKVPADDAAVLFLPRQQEQVVDLGETFDELLGWYLRHAELPVAAGDEES